MTISDGDFSAEVTPSANAFAFFPVDYQADDARLRGSSLLGGRALALDTHVDRAFLTSSDEVQKHTIVDGGISASAYNSYLLAVEREELEKSRLKALVAMQGRIAAFADNASSDSLGEDLRGLASIVESFLFSEALALDLALVAERVRLSSYAEHSRLVSVVSAEEIGVLATEVAFQAALGNQGAISNFLRGLDHLVSAQITGVAREFALIEAVGLDVVTHLNEIFSAINHAFYGDSS
jgi:hypothetical protein